MTKDEKEFFDKAVLAAITGLSARTDINYVAGDAISIAESALGERNHYLAASGYQEPPQAEPLPGVFGNLTVGGKPVTDTPFDTSPVITIPELADHVHVGAGAGAAAHWTLRSSDGLKQSFRPAGLGTEATHYIPTTTVAEPSAITSHEIPADVNLCTKTCIPVRDILAVANENKGKKLTTTEIFWLVYPGGPSLIDPPTINHLRDIGIVLRRHGYQIKRSGGKDLYQL